MRKAMLAVTSVTLGVVLLVLFGVAVLWQYIGAQREAVAHIEIFPFPRDVGDSDLRALQLIHYEGPFWEDATNAEVENVAALLVENTGGYVAQGAVVLEWGEERMVFELYDIPPDSKVLVLEKDKQPFRTGIPTECYGWETEMYPHTMGYVAVEPVGDVSILVNNCTDQIMPVVWICYKSCDPESGMLIGGISYGMEVRDLQPGEGRIVTPHHYAGNSSVVLYVTTWVEE